MTYLAPPQQFPRHPSRDSDITAVSCEPSKFNCSSRGNVSAYLRSRPPSPYSGKWNNIELSDIRTPDSNPEEADLSSFCLSTLSATLSASNVARPASVVAPPGTGEIAEPVCEISDLHVEPINPEMLSNQRYDNRPRIPLNQEEIPNVPAKTMSFRNRDIVLPPGWKSFKHPEGGRYFRKLISGTDPITGTRLSQDRKIVIFTDTWLYDKDNVAIIQQLEEQMCRKLGEHDDLPEDAELVIEAARHDSGYACSYYLASKSTRSIFWLEEVVPGLISQYQRPASEVHYLEEANEALFWLHVTMFPHKRHLQRKLIDEVNETLNFLSFDSKTSETSTGPYGYDDISSFSSMLQNVKAGAGPHSQWVVARMMYIICWDQYLNLHGLREARMARDASIFDRPEKKQSRIFRIISFCLFYFPTQYFTDLQRVWIDQGVNHRPWKMFIAELLTDWEKSITPSTVVLTANVGLLAIQSIDTGHVNRSTAQIMSYISTFFSVGNIILCAILTRQHRPSRLSTAESAMEYLTRKERITGLPFLAIIFSLPSAFFLHGMLTFYIAIIWVCIYDTGFWTRLTTGVVIAVVSSAIVVVVFIEFYHPKEREGEWDPRFFRVVRRFKEMFSLRLWVGQQREAWSAPGRWCRRPKRHDTDGSPI